MADISKERYRLCKVQSKLANNCQNDGVGLVKQRNKVGARFMCGLQYAT